MPGANYPIITSKIGKRRKREGKQSSVYRGGKQLSAAKIWKDSCRHGYMTTLERVQMAQGISQQGRSSLFTPANSSAAPDAAPSPETPPGIEICTPPPYPLFQRDFLDLPILQFLRSTTTVFGKMAIG